jgi:integrase
MPRVTRGHVATPSGSWRARAYAGVDPVTQRETRLKATAKTEQEAYIEPGRLLKLASEGRTPESGATMAKLLDEYAAIAPWDVSTRQTNEGFIRRTIKPSLGMPGGTVALGAGGADTDTQRPSPEPLFRVSSGHM